MYAKVKGSFFLQDPPSFRVIPRPEYLQEVGRELIIPCEAIGDPTPNITWSKVQETFLNCWRHFSRVSHNSLLVLTYCHLSSQIGPSPRSMYTVLANGSLLLQPLSKDHHGGWECLATNRVATVSTGTVVMVLGECVSTVQVNVLSCVFMN